MSAWAPAIYTRRSRYVLVNESPSEEYNAGDHCRHENRASEIRLSLTAQE